MKGGVRWSRPSDETTDQRTTKSYKAREAALSTKLGFQLQLSLLLSKNGNKCRVKKRAGSTHQSSDEDEHASMHILTLERLLEGKNPSKVGE